MHIDYYESPVGILRIRADEKGITDLNIVRSMDESPNPNPIITASKTQLDLYFAGESKGFDLPLNLESWSDFYKKVWAELVNIPFGRTVSYLDIAKKLGDPKSTRAVGMANGKNPIAIIVPCHRVIGSDGSLTGYAYGTEVKRKLLALENPKEYSVNGVLF
ncbi:methylated-DNA--[protein]-cysteine S-methyltransferase [Portibacter lacus]|uniref:Methylated-DNA--protein-cysteine methyltransferase n=1 Tax=Portibacter lacus TaxID=1099794 RepID=A0AA37SNN2_9BACT|nr:methylated-DNA--[protein]-cysteine S-methyltransferase [Portibacter lacus]GLR17941.1 methylated-DNA--protein-cysteine methyltransferase [Portibacter lacus]